MAEADHESGLDEVCVLTHSPTPPSPHPCTPSYVSPQTFRPDPRARGLYQFDYDGDDTHDATTEDPAEEAAPTLDAAANGTAGPETAAAGAESSAEDAAADQPAADAPAAAPEPVPGSGCVRRSSDFCVYTK